MLKTFCNKNFVICNKTSRSKSSKPIKGQYYIVHKRVETNWGSKIILTNELGDEIWGDPAYLDPIESDNIEPLVKKKLLSGYELFLDSIYTPTICTITNKNSAGSEVVFSSGQRSFLTSKLVRNFEEFKNKKVNESIAIEIPVWFAKKNNIIKS